MARPGPKAGGKQAHSSEETKKKMVAAALESLHEEGILGASARAIARRGDFNQGLIFYHFGGVNELLLAAVDELSQRRAERYEQRLESVSTLRELVTVAGELHAEDLEDGHITVLAQMLAGATTNAELRAPLRERFAPWIDIVERSVKRALADTPYVELVPVHDLAMAITALFIGLEQMLILEDDAERANHQIFQTIGVLAGIVEAMLGLPPPSRPPA